MTSKPDEHDGNDRRRRSALAAWLFLALACAGVRADEPGPTLKDLIKQDSKGQRTLATDFAIGEASFYSIPHVSGTRDLLLVSWFRGDAYSALRYTVSEKGVCRDILEIVNRAPAGLRQRELTPDELGRLKSAIDKLPESKAEPPIKRTVLVGFQSGDKWRTETYDSAALPDGFEKVMQIIGERDETKHRHKKKYPAHPPLTPPS